MSVFDEPTVEIEPRELNALLFECADPPSDDWELSIEWPDDSPVSEVSL